MNTRRSFLGLALSLFLSTALVACPGAQVTAGLHVNVAADTCKEQDDAGPVSTEWVDLSCGKVEGGGSVTVTFPRREWQDIKLRRLVADAGENPGK